MSDTDVLDLDGQLLRTLIVIYEEGSVSRAGELLRINQSTISHRLERLRQKLGDPLFVRAGRGIVATPRTEVIVPRAIEALAAMRQMVEPDEFSPAGIDDTFVVAATDYERAIFLIDAYREILQEAPNIRLNFVWEKYDNSLSLRRNHFDLAISPIEGMGEQDIKRRVLYQDEIVCYYDPEATVPPDTLERYSGARHVRVQFSDSDSSFVDKALAPHRLTRLIAIDMPSISELPRLMKGTPLVATLPARLKDSLMKDLACCAAPFETEKLTYSLFWHDRTHRSKKHAWLRDQIINFTIRLDRRD